MESDQHTTDSFLVGAVETRKKRPEKPAKASSHTQHGCQAMATSSCAGQGWAPTSVCRWCKALYSFFISDSRSSNRETRRHSPRLSAAQPTSPCLLASPRAVHVGRRFQYTLMPRAEPRGTASPASREPRGHEKANPGCVNGGCSSPPQRVPGRLQPPRDCYPCLSWPWLLRHREFAAVRWR